MQIDALPTGITVAPNGPAEETGAQCLGARAPLEDYEAQASRNGMEARLMALLQGHQDEMHRMRAAFEATTKTVQET